MTRYRQLIDLQGSPAEIRTARRAVKNIDFDWSLLTPGLQKLRLTTLTVRFQYPTFRDKDGNPIGHQFWGQSIGSVATVLLNPDIDPYDQGRTLGHELGHQVRALIVGPAKQDEIHLLFHPKPTGGFEAWSGPVAGVRDPRYLGYAEEGFAIAFGHVFADTSSASQGRFTHKLRQADYDAFRGIVLRPRRAGEPEPPVVPDPPPTEPEPPTRDDLVRAAFDRVIGEAEAGIEALEAV